MRAFSTSMRAIRSRVRPSCSRGWSRGPCTAVTSVITAHATISTAVQKLSTGVLPARPFRLCFAPSDLRREPPTHLFFRSDERLVRTDWDRGDAVERPPRIWRRARNWTPFSTHVLGCPRTFPALLLALLSNAETSARLQPSAQSLSHSPLRASRPGCTR
jgi:hypothetical protein